MDGLEPVADVRQRTTDDDAHRVVEVGAPQLLLDGHGDHAPDGVGHPRTLAKRSP